MSTELQSPSPTAQLPDPTASSATASVKRRNRTAAGAVLVSIGLFLLLAQWTNWALVGWLILPALALIFLAWGLINRNFGLVIPGCILGGLGLGIFLMIGPFSGLFAAVQPGVFMLCFAGGFAMITLLSLFMDDRIHWWPLIPAAIIGLVGVALMTGELGINLLKLLGYGWPLILIGIGLYFIVRRRE